MTTPDDLVVRLRAECVKTFGVVCVTSASLLSLLDALEARTDLLRRADEQLAEAETYWDRASKPGLFLSETAVVRDEIAAALTSSSEGEDVAAITVNTNVEGMGHG